MNARLLLPILLFALCGPLSAQNRLPAKIREKLRKSTAYILSSVDSSTHVGSGFVIRTEGNTVWIATNEHVISSEEVGVETKKESKLRVVFDSQDPDAPKYPAELLAKDVDHDLAILKVALDHEPPAAYDLHSKQELAENLPISVFGFPLGDKFLTITTGEITGFDTDPEHPLSVGNLHRIKVGVKVDKGNSGGPMVDNKGALVGVIFQKDLRTDNVAYSIPNVELHRLLMGRLGNLKLKHGGDGSKFTMKISGDVLDPYRKLQKVVVHSAAKKDLPKDVLRKSSSLHGSQWKLLSKEMKKTEREVTGDKMEIDVEAEGTSGEEYYLQFEHFSEGGKSYITPPMKVFLGGRLAEEDGRRIPLPDDEPVDLTGETVSGRGIDATELKINAAEAMPMLWDAQHNVLYVVETNGKVRKIDITQRKQDAMLDLKVKCKASAVANEGLVVLTEEKSELWVLDKETLQVRDRGESLGAAVFPLKDVAHLASAPSSQYAYVVNQAGDTMRVVDLFDGTVAKEWKFADLGEPKTAGGAKPTGFGPLALTPDGRWLFWTNGGALHRCSVKETALTYEQSSPAFAPGAERVVIAPRGDFVTLLKPDGHQSLPERALSGQGLYLFAVGNLARPGFAVETGQTTHFLNVDTRAQQIYGAFKNSPLVLFDMQGQKVREFPELKGETARQLLPYNKARGLLMVLTEQKLYLVKSSVK